MFYVLSKVAWAFAVPSTFLVLVVAAGLVAAFVGPLATAGLAAAIGGTVLLLVLGFAPVGTALLLPLEQRFPAYRDEGRVDGIVVLGGGIYTEISQVRDQLSMGEANERVLYMADLARRHPEAVLVFAGGGAEGEPAEADIVARFAAVAGLPAERIRYDRTSRNTWENATHAATLVAPKPGERWLLVTSARHMPRAMGCFRRAGLAMTAFPVDYLTVPGALSGQDSVAAGLSRVDDAVKEWLGLLAYRLTDRTSALYPSPDPSSPPGPASGGPSR